MHVFIFLILGISISKLLLSIGTLKLKEFKANDNIEKMYLKIQTIYESLKLLSRIGFLKELIREIILIMIEIKEYEENISIF